MKATALSVATLLRAQERLEDTLAQMTVAEANTMPHPLIKSVTWLMWHTGRELDLQVSDLKGEPSLWQNAGWSERVCAASTRRYRGVAPYTTRSGPSDGG